MDDERGPEQEVADPRMGESDQEEPRRRPGIYTNDLPEIFRYHPPTPNQEHAYHLVRDAARAFAFIIVTNVPNCPDRTAAIRKVREAVMTANAAIALGGRY